MKKATRKFYNEGVGDKSKDKYSQVVTKTSGGIPIGKYPPYETKATVTSVTKERTTVQRREGETDHDFTVTTEADIEWENEGRQSHGTLHFEAGDVTPGLGQNVWGVVTTSQWGRTEFHMTHILED